MEHFAPAAFFHIGSFPVTNTILTTLLVDGLIILALYLLTKHFSKIPNIFQSLVELVIETFYNLTESVSSKNAAIIFPFFMSFFLFILLSNWIGILPGVGTIGFFEHGEHGEGLIPLFRGGTSDINTTLALALISVVATHYLSIKLTGIKDYLSRFFSLNPIYLFVGLLEIVSEATKLISLSFRLFGNIFAGEVVLATVGNIFAFGFPIPFLLLEMIVGVVQALVFAMLTMAFMSILTTPHHAEAHNK